MVTKGDCDDRELAEVDDLASTTLSSHDTGAGACKVVKVVICFSDEHSMRRSAARPCARCARMGETAGFFLSPQGIGVLRKQLKVISEWLKKGVRFSKEARCKPRVLESAPQ